MVQEQENRHERSIYSPSMYIAASHDIDLGILADAEDTQLPNLLRHERKKFLFLNLRIVLALCAVIVLT